MKITTEISLDLARNTMPITLFAKQFDNDTREILITMLDRGQAYTLESGITARLQIKKPDGTQVIKDCTIAGGKISAELSGQALAAAGVATAEIGLYKGEELLTSQTFLIDIKPSAYDFEQVESSDEYSSLVQATAEADKWGNVTAKAQSVSAEESASVTLKDTEDGKEFDFKIPRGKNSITVVQETGESTEDVMSQKAVTDALKNAGVGKASKFDATSEIFNSYDGEDANAAGTELEEEQTPFYAHAEGYGNSALAKGSHAEGHGNTIENGCDNSHAEGDGNSITQGSANCHAEGSGNEISQSSRNCHAEGNGNSISQGGQNGHLCGTGNTMEGSSQNSFANGKQNHLKDSAQNSFINGETNTIQQGSKNSLVNGWTNSLGGASQQALVSGASSTYTNIINSICTGYANNVIGWNISSPTDGACLAVFGYYITAQSVGGSLITGASSTVKNSKFVVCCGVSNSVLSANHSTALGKDNSIDYTLTNRTQGDAVCTVIGYWNDIKGAYECLAIGGFNNIKPEYDDDVATGDSPMNSIALGRDNDLIGHLDDVIAIGNENKVTHSSDGVIIGTSNELKSDSKSNPKGDNYALGYRNIITNGNHCYSFGYDNEIAEGVFDLIVGIGLKTDGTPNPFPQTVYGAYNEPVQAALLIVGAGRDNVNRKNALYIDPNGIIHIQQQAIFEGEIVPNGGISGYATKEDIAQIAGNSTFVSVSYADGAISVTEDSGINEVTKTYTDEEPFVLYDGTNRNKGYTAHFTWTNAEHTKNAEIIGFVRPTGTVVVFNGVISELGSDITLYADDGEEIGTISINEDRVLSFNFTGDRSTLKMEGYITTFRQG